MLVNSNFNNIHCVHGVLVFSAGIVAASNEHTVVECDNRTACVGCRKAGNGREPPLRRGIITVEASAAIEAGQRAHCCAIRVDVLVRDGCARLPPPPSVPHNSVNLSKMANIVSYGYERNIPGNRKDLNEKEMGARKDAMLPGTSKGPCHQRRERGWRHAAQSVHGVQVRAVNNVSCATYGCGPHVIRRLCQRGACTTTVPTCD